MKSGRNPQPRASAPKRRFRLVLALVVLVGLIVAVIYRVPRYALERAGQAIAVREYEEAERWLDRAARWGAPESEIVMHKARIARLNGDGIAAARLLQTAIRHRVPEERIDLEWLMADAQAGHTAQLESVWLEMLDQFPEEGPELSYALVVGKTMNWDYATAEQLLDAWQLGDPEDPRIYFLRGEIHRRQQRYEPAIESYRIAHALAPHWLDVKIAEAASLNALRRFDEALQIFTEARQQDPDRADVLLGQARAAMESGRFEIAIDAAGRLVELYPRHEAGRLVLAQSQQANGDYEASIEALGRLLEDFPQHLQANQLAATAYAAVGETEKSTKHAELYQRALDETQRWRRLNVTLPGRKDDPDFLFSLARMVYPFQPADSYSLLKKYVAMRPQSVDAYRMLADLAELAGNVEAKDQYERLIRRIEKSSRAVPSQQAAGADADETVE